MRSRTTVLAATLAILAAAPAIPPLAQAAPTMTVPLDWTAGPPLVGLTETGADLWPEDERGPHRASFALAVSPCHRDLSLGVRYDPDGVGASVETDGLEVEGHQPFRFRAHLVAPDGTETPYVFVDEPDLSVDLGTVPEGGNHTLVMELIEGVVTDWEVRVRAFRVHGDPTCGVWLNEVELDPPGPDAGEEWVELYNAGADPVDVSGWTILGRSAQASGNGTPFTIPEGTVLDPGTYTVVTLAGGEHLDEVNETVVLEPPSGATLDRSAPLTDRRGDAWTNQRATDGGSGWVLGSHTRGKSNG